VNRERIVVAGWGRAILLQLAHPLVAAGVADHSTFRANPLAPVQRLHSTIGAMLSLTFGDEDEMVAAAAGINLIHDRVFGRAASGAGVTPAGAEYSAHDPALLRWVHATLLESIPLAYERFVGPLSAADRDRYCADAALMEPLLDIPEGSLPRDAAALERYMRSMFEEGRIAVSKTARTLGRDVLYPRFSSLAWPAIRPVRLFTIGTLPASIREQYGFGWTPRDARAQARWERGIRRAVGAAPAALRHWPAARRLP
jgi:uncharacterized protein (DUF2236 family)